MRASKILDLRAEYYNGHKQEWGGKCAVCFKAKSDAKYPLICETSRISKTYEKTHYSCKECASELCKLCYLERRISFDNK